MRVDNWKILWTILSWPLIHIEIVKCKDGILRISSLSFFEKGGEVVRRYSYYPRNQPFLVSDSKWLVYWPLSLYTKKIKMKFHSWFKNKVGININSFMFFLRQLTKISWIPFFEGMSHKLCWRLKFALLSQSGISAELYSHMVQWSIKRIFK